LLHTRLCAGLPLALVRPGTVGVHAGWLLIWRQWLPGTLLLDTGFATVC